MMEMIKTARKVLYLLIFFVSKLQFCFWFGRPKIFIFPPKIYFDKDGFIKPVIITKEGMKKK